LFDLILEEGEREYFSYFPLIIQLRTHLDESDSQWYNCFSLRYVAISRASISAALCLYFSCSAETVIGKQVIKQDI
jgi:hypothetical protein